MYDFSSVFLMTAVLSHTVVYNVLHKKGHMSLFPIPLWHLQHSTRSCSQSKQFVLTISAIPSSVSTEYILMIIYY